MSTIPHVSWYFGSVYVSSGFIIANFGRIRSLPIPDLSCVSSSVSTAELLISLPAAEIVKTVPTGSAFFNSFLFFQNSQISVPGFAAPIAIPFAVSIALPPPTARISSAPKAIAFSTPFLAKDRRGFGFTPPSSS